MTEEDGKKEGGGIERQADVEGGSGSFRIRKSGTVRRFSVITALLCVSWREEGRGGEKKRDVNG